MPNSPLIIVALEPGIAAMARQISNAFAFVIADEFQNATQDCQIGGGFIALTAEAG